MRFVIVDCTGGGEGGGVGIGGGGVQVSLVASDRVPGAGVVIGHEVPEIKILVHFGEMEFFVILRTWERRLEEENGGQRWEFTCRACYGEKPSPSKAGCGTIKCLSMLEMILRSC